MGFYDRPYYRDEPRGFGGAGGAAIGGRGPLGGISAWSVNTWIILANVAVFVIDALLLRMRIGYIFELGRTQYPMGLLEYWGHFSGDTAIWHGQIWRFISFQFLHASFFHIFFNMLALYFFGPMIERYLGSRRYLAFYLISGVAGAVGYLLLWATGLIYAHPGVPLVGASAGVFGVLIAGALVAPNTTVMLLIPPIPIKLSTLAWILVGVAAFTVLFYGDRPGSNAGGEAAHLGGAAMGWLLIRRPHLLRWAEGLGDGSKQSMRQRIERHLQERREDKQAQLEEEVDRILLKVSQQGLGSLTEREKRTLRNATESRRDRR